jgi:chromosome segregation protein
MARDLAQRLPGQRFVTHAGELLEADGTLTVGVHRAEAGILSRKSELRELQRQAVELASAIDDADRAIADDIEQGERIESQIRGLQQELDVLGEQAADLRERIGQRRERRDGLHEEVALARTELTGIDAELNDLAAKASAAEARAVSAEAEAQGLQARIAGGEAELRARDHDRLQAQNEQTAARVGLAQIEERRHALHQRREQLEREVAERQAACDRIREHESALGERLTACLAAQLQASAELAETCAALERAGDRLDAARTRRDAAHAALRRLHEQMQIAHDQWQARQDETHACELRANDVRIRREALIQRLREEQQIDLEEEDRRAPASAAETDGPAGDAVETEIDDLRKKLSRLGAVNLESLTELAELETRDRNLRVQYDDLTAAHRSLNDIIAAINEDSRRLFIETFTLVRSHFQDLFRRLFGGGQADVILENEADVLESGVEVVARPPGKELRSISLMSGGEKTLTAVALLLAIFRSKPSPFCLLDEVDAALDEANTGRLALVIREFLDRSQFIIITHSKRTMAAADVLYGITMQESGVSKRIAVRFEDWPEDGRQAA